MQALFTPCADIPANHKSFFQGFKLVIKTKTYMLLLACFLWVWMSVAVLQANMLLYMKYVVARADQFNYILVRDNRESCLCFYSL